MVVVVVMRCCRGIKSPILGCSKSESFLHQQSNNGGTASLYGSANPYIQDNFPEMPPKLVQHFCNGLQGHPQANSTLTHRRHSFVFSKIFPIHTRLLTAL